MLQMMDEGRTPAHWAAKNNYHPMRPSTHSRGGPEPLQIALINNMPDSALEDTESQFFELLDTAAGELPVRIRLYSLPGVRRSDRGKLHLSNFYFDFRAFWNTRFDGVIITGTEPLHPDLRKEPYWHALAEALEWAEVSTASTVLSCLAAHAAVLQGDGIGRQPLPDKQFGVFDERKACDHELTSQTPELLRFPHSRWNEVREDALLSSGYTVLTKSAEAGVNLFVKKRRKSLFVHFQGHPEYLSGTLFKEYRRDIKRFLRGERKTYPSMPQGYFDPATARALARFQERALFNPREELMSDFPAVAAGHPPKSAWHAAAIRVYRNWLQYVASKKTTTSVFAATARGTGVR
jgi:homoserine O-succinyltransferase